MTLHRKSIAAGGDIGERIRRVRLTVFDFDGVMTDNAVYVFEDGREAVRCSRGDGLGISMLHKIGMAMAVISTEPNPVVTARCRKLKLPCIQACDDKPAALRALMVEHRLAPEQVAFMGNDANDAGCLAMVGLPVVPQDAHPSVLPLAALRTEMPGGQGAVRELCDLFVEVLTRDIT